MPKHRPSGGFIPLIIYPYFFRNRGRVTNGYTSNGESYLTNNAIMNTRNLQIDQPATAAPDRNNPKKVLIREIYRGQ